jgi:DNA-binding winged helix-turn-helix (wHTH) protein
MDGVSPSRCYRFGAFVLDRLDERLWMGTAPVPLGGKALAVLERLLARPNQLVTKDELLSAVWPDTAVTEAVLTTAVRHIRSAIGDNARRRRLVETVYGRGYRFVGQVEPVDEPPTPGAGAPTESSLVGREAEWARLHELLQHVRHRQERRIVLIAGEAGIGKTALIHAFTAAACVDSDVQVAYGHCVDQYGAGEAYMPLLEALVRLSGDAGPEVAALLREHAPNWIAHLPGGDQPPPASAPVRPERMLRELAQAVEAIGSARPLLLVLEDLQWSDRATLEWLAYMVRRRDPARLLVLGTYRPPGALPHHTPLREVVPELRHQAQTTEVVLDYLAPDAVRQYVQRRCGDSPELYALAGVLHRRTGGHPLFLAGIVDGLVSPGGAAGAPIDTRLAATSIPVNVRKFIEDRVQQLSSHDRAVLEAASVVGEQFSIAAVAGATDLPEGEVEATCAAWSQHDRILVADGTAAWPDGTISALYRFRHALFQETIYLHISPERRARLHAAIGNRLEAASGPGAASLAAELAVHFDEGRDPVKAIAYREQAARNAIQRSAYHDAQHHLSRAQVLVRGLPPGRDRLRREAACALLLAQVLEAREGWGVEGVLRQYAQARDLCLALGDDASLLRATWGLTAASVVRAKYRRTQASAMELLRLARRRHDALYRRAAHTELGGTALLLGRSRAARRHFAAAEALGAGDGRRSSIEIFGMDIGIFTRVWATHATWYIGFPDRAQERVTEVLRAAASGGHPFTVTIALAYAAMLAQFRRDRAETRRLADAAIAHATEHDFPYYRAFAEALRGWTLTTDGRDCGIREMRDAIAILRSIAGIRLPFYHALLAEGFLAAGCVEDGLQAVAQALAQVEGTDERWWEPELHRVRGELLRRSIGGTHEAAACFRTAIDVARRNGARPLELRAAVGLVRLLGASAGGKDSRSLLRERYDAFTEGSETVDLQEARAALGN